MAQDLAERGHAPMGGFAGAIAGGRMPSWVRAQTSQPVAGGASVAQVRGMYDPR
jgi:hypothetical protein